MEVAKLAAPPNLEVRFVSCNESAIKRWLSSELEETVFSLTHELFMSKHHTVTLRYVVFLGCGHMVTKKLHTKRKIIELRLGNLKFNILEERQCYG